MHVKGVFRNIALIMCLFGGGVFVFRTKHHFLSEDTEDASEAPVKPLHASLGWVGRYVRQQYGELCPQVQFRRRVYFGCHLRPHVWAVSLGAPGPGRAWGVGY